MSGWTTKKPAENGFSMRGLETTMTTFKNNIILRANLEHSET